MLRILLVASVATLAISSSAEASVLANVSQDTLTIDGDAAADQISLRLAPGAPNTLLLDQAAVDRSTFSRIVIRSGAGADTVRIDESNGVFTTAETTTIETGAGGDTVSGGSGAETIATGDDADLVNSGAGDDTVSLGAGDDTLLQNPGAGFDTLGGQSGSDTLRINGSAEAEELTVQAHLGRLLVNRDSGDAGMSAATVETLEVNAGGGADLVDAGDLTGSGLTRLDADLGLNDGARDAVAMNLTDAGEAFELHLIDDRLISEGAPYELRVENAVASDDRMTVLGGNGSDVLITQNDAAAAIELTLDGGAGPDEFSGDAAFLRGGDGDDFADVFKGNRGIDLGAGNDRVRWFAGSGAKSIEGGPGTDQVSVFGDVTDDLFHVAANGPRVRVHRNLVDPLDIGTTEAVIVDGALGADRVVTSDLAGTPTTLLEVRPGLGDDTVFVNGTPGADHLRVSKFGLIHTVAGQGQTLNINGAEPTDRLQVNGAGGDDALDASQMGADQLETFLEGGPGKDTIIGSPGWDEVSGGTDADVVSMGGGTDVFTWTSGHGSDVVDGGAGTDFVRMDGTGAPEQFDVSPSGIRARVTSGLTVVDLGTVERLNVLPGGGIDTLRVRDLTGTVLDVVDWNLAPFRDTPTSDGNVDNLTVDGTFGNDTINVTTLGGLTRVYGLAAQVRINRSDLADRLTVDTKPGPDSLTVSPAVHNLLTFSST